MKQIALSTVASVTAGQGAPKPDEFSKNGTPFVRAGSLEELLAGKNEADLELVTEKIAKKRKLKLYPRGSILFAKSGMSATKDRIYVLQSSAYVVSHLAILIPNNQINTDYLRLALKKFPPSALIQDLAYPSISLGEIQTYEIPVPEEFEDQIRIAHLLSKVEELIAQRKQHLQQLDELLKSVFLEMFGDPVRNERGWDKVSFSNILAEIESGKSPTCEARQATEGEWGVLKLGSVTSCVYKQEENKALPQDVAPDTRWEVKQGDLIFSRKNTYELVAACAYVFETRSKLLLPDLIFRFVFKDDAEIHPLFIWKLLTADSQRKQVQSLAAGASGSMPNISKANLKQTLLIKPPIELQDEFAGIVERVEGIKARYQASLAELERLYGVLSQRAFKGELDLSRVVVPDVSTEPDIETQEMHTEDTESLSPLSALLEATINPPEADHRILVPHFNAYLDTLNGGEFNLESCASFIQDQVVGLDPEYPYFLSLHEYETIYKKLIFDALADGRLEQTRNIVVIDDKEDFGNNIILRPCKVQRE